MEEFFENKGKVRRKWQATTNKKERG